MHLAQVVRSRPPRRIRCACRHQCCIRLVEPPRRWQAGARVDMLDSGRHPEEHALTLLTCINVCVFWWGCSKQLNSLGTNWKCTDSQPCMNSASQVCAVICPSSKHIIWLCRIFFDPTYPTNIASELEQFMHGTPRAQLPAVLRYAGAVAGVRTCERSSWLPLQQLQCWGRVRTPCAQHT